METQDRRYAPPRSLELELPPETPPDHCEHVAWTCRLMWIGFAATALDTLLGVFTHRGPQYAESEFIGLLRGLAITFAIVFWFTIKLQAGRNWMRLLVTILNAVVFVAAVCAILWLGSMGAAGQIFTTLFNGGAVEGANSLLQFALIVAELVLLNTPSSRAWFQAKKYSR